jgi:hypothetical protein
MVPVGILLGAVAIPSFIFCRKRVQITEDGARVTWGVSYYCPFRVKKYPK